jgi:nucleoid DNA-binding protein
MTADELVEFLSRDCEQPIDVIRDVFQALAAAAAAELAKGERVMLPGLGALSSAVCMRQGARIVVVNWTTRPQFHAQVEGLASASARAEPPGTRGPLKRRKLGRET